MIDLVSEDDSSSPAHSQVYVTPDPYPVLIGDQERLSSLPYKPVSQIQRFSRKDRLRLIRIEAQDPSVFPRHPKIVSHKLVRFTILME